MKQLHALGWFAFAVCCSCRRCRFKLSSWVYNENNEALRARVKAYNYRECLVMWAASCPRTRHSLELVVIQSSVHGHRWFASTVWWRPGVEGGNIWPICCQRYGPEDTRCMSKTTGPFIILSNRCEIMTRESELRSSSSSSFGYSKIRPSVKHDSPEREPHQWLPV